MSNITRGALAVILVGLAPEARPSRWVWQQLLL